jgi:hypothetical protein
MRLPRQLFIISGIAAVVTSIAIGGLSFQSALAGGDPCITPDPTASIAAGVIQAFGEQVCETPTEDLPNLTHTPTTAPTEEPEPTDTPAPSTPAPTTAPATNTPSGGAGAGGVQPPNTGTGGADAGNSVSSMWMIAAFALLAGGLGSFAYGMRRK